MTLQSTGAISISQINVEKGLSSTAANSSLTTLSTTSINTNSTSKPDQSVPHAMSEFYSYNHNAAPPEATTINGATVIGSTQPGDGGGSIEVSWSLNNSIGTRYVTIEGVVTAGDPITTLGSTGQQGNFTSSPSTINATLGSNAGGYVIVRLYTSAGSLLDTVTTRDDLFPL
jgi:hypothetical protein